MAEYDTVIIGAGHNGLVCASYLAKRGRKVLVLEASDTCGGLASTNEFHPGFRASVAHTVGHFPRKIVHELGLEQHGFSAASKPLANIGLDRGGNHVIADGNRLSGVGAHDGTAWTEYRQLMSRFAEMLAPFWLKTVPPIGNNSMSELMSFAQLGMKVRMLGKEDMREFLRMVSLPMYDLMDEYFEHPLLKAMLCWDGLAGSKQAPRSPNDSVLQLLYRMHCAQVLPAENVTGVIDALRAVAESLGVEIRLGSAVDEISIDPQAGGLTATGVTLRGGEQVTAGNVVSSADPKITFLKLLGVDHLEIEFTNRIRRIRTEGRVGKLHLALNSVPAFRGIGNPDGRLFITPDMATMERAFDDAKYGGNPGEPVMEITIPSLRDPTLAPQGQHVMSAQVMYLPTNDAGGREALKEKLIDTIAAYAPGIREQIVASEFLLPVDLEAKFHTTGGHWHQGDFALDQMLMMRPTYGAAQYRTPIDGLYLCGAGSHPAGDVTGAPGHNAAGEILK